MAQPAEAPARRRGCSGGPVALARWPQARRRDPSRRDLRHDRDRRRRRDGQQFPPVAAAARLVHGDAHAVHLRLFGRDLWRRRAGFSDEWSVAALKRFKPMNLYGWSKHLFDLALADRVPAEGETAAAMGGLQVLQRVRPERVPQGRDDEPGREALRRRQGRQADPAVQVASRGHRATASRAAISSMSTMRWRWCAGCSTPRRSPASSMSEPARRAASTT